MKNAVIKYSVRFLSDTCCGSGAGNGTDVDVNAVFDDYGLPVIPSKRLRGLLREQAFRLEELYGREAIIDLFGDSGKKSRLIVENAETDNAEIIHQGLDTKEYSASEVSSLYTVKHAATRIDTETGVAQKTSLRTVETVKAGVRLSGKVYIDNPSDTDIMIIEGAFRLLRGIGMDKHRGLGEIRCETEKAEITEEYSAPAVFSSSDKQVGVEYTVTLLQNVALMLNSPMQNPDYIPGAAVQGALAKYFAEKDYFAELFFSDLKFGNAYIATEEKRFAPASMAYVKIKNEAGKVYDLASGYEKLADKQYVPCGGYLCTEGNNIYSLSVKQGVDYHINKGQNNSVKINKDKNDDEGKNGENFFNTERISSAQTFRGMIYGSSTAISEVKKALGSGIIRLGASLSSEYGKCRISLKDISVPEGKKFRAGQTVVVTLQSDAIVFSKNGTNSVRVSDLIDSLGGNLSVVKDTDNNEMAYTKTLTTGGYNAKWGMPKPQYYAFAKGSTFVFRCKSDVEIPAFIGYGNSEGYGFVNATVQSDVCEYTACRTESAAKNLIHSGPVSEIEEKILRKRQEEKTEKAGAVAAESLNTGSVSDSAVMRLLSAYQNMYVRNDLSIESLIEWKNKNFDKNNDLQLLTEKIVKVFEKSGLSEDLFPKYLRAFIVRYKELSMNAKKQ